MKSESRFLLIAVNLLLIEAIEKALPASITIKINKEDVNDIDFVVLQRPKKIDIRGYLNYTDEEESW
jgi:hypothetical protein